ncbi:hypothetical protein [Xenorhabdus bovienii]|uniref:hypothetical protein n=1 Tax=Xenorhabdus bovienii TaxID=40576 RepID=UPI0023B233EC|nr:hypothetical protein [Xenorhabdus bovienii]
MHLYIGSQLTNILSFTETLKSAFREINRIDADFISSIKVLNMGGGFPAVYGKRTQPEIDLSQETALLQGITKIIKDHNFKNAELIFESGRAIVGSTGRLKCTILNFNSSCASPYIVVNTCIAQIADLYLIRKIKELELEFYNPASVKSQPVKFKVFGSSCTQLDMLGYVMVDESQLKIGNMLFCDNLGAYCSNASLNGFHSKRRIK